MCPLVENRLERGRAFRSQLRSKGPNLSAVRKELVLHVVIHRLGVGDLDPATLCERHGEEAVPASADMPDQRLYEWRHFAEKQILHRAIDTWRGFSIEEDSQMPVGIGRP